MHYIFILLALLTSAVICILAIPSIVRVAKSKKLFDTPGQRNRNGKKIPTLGGLAIFAGIIISTGLFSQIALIPEFPFVVTGSVILFSIGIKDDILIIAPRWKLAGQIIAALAVVFLGGLKINTFPGTNDLQEFSSLFLLTSTVLVIIFIINSFNLIDGIDGLASGIGILSTLIFGLVFYRSGLNGWTMLAASVFGALVGFTGFNVWGGKNKIFMGDTGSLLLGFFLALMFVRVMNIEKPYFCGFQILTPWAFGISVLIVPLFDTIRIIIIRLFQKRSPFRPDRQHIHYRLLDVGLTHIQASGILLGVNLILIACVMVFEDIGEIPLIILLFVMATMFSLILEYILRAKHKPI